MIRDLKPYPAYRDSGVPWLGEVPEHWEVLAALAAYKPKLAKNTGMIERTVLSLSYGRIVVKPQEKLHGLVPESYETYQIVDPGDIVVRTTDLQNDHTSLRVGHSEHRGIITAAYMCLQTRDQMTNGFGYRLLSAYELMKIIYGFGSGLRQSIDFSHIKRMPVMVPPPDEQSAIVRFLDHVDRRIRCRVRAKQKLIALLHEQKQAIIHRAVTRGLDPNVRLKPSGVEWLGDVPEDWEVSELRRLVRRGKRITYGIVQPGELDSSGRFMVRGQDYSFGWVAPEAVFRVSDAVERPYKRSRLSTGDIVLTIVGAGVGNVALVPAWLDGANITQTTARVSVDSAKSDPEFIASSLQGPVGRRNVELYVKGAAQPGLNLEHVRVFRVPVPPLDEQGRIVEATRNCTASHDTRISRASREIALLREFRTRLIADVVTGKLDVREAAAHLPEETDEPEPLDDTDTSPEDIGEETEATDPDAALEEAEA
jgi:type I restriction enzyme S subunit